MKETIFRRLPVISLLSVIFAFSSSVYAGGDAAAGKTKSAACGGCHGMDGNSVVPTFPKMAGQGERYIVKQITDFKANKSRQDPVMLGMVAALKDQDAADIGAYYQAQKLAGAATFDESKIASGREIYKGGNLQAGVPACQSCHGGNGNGNAPAGYPQVGGQHVDYTIKQLKAFKDGTRSNDDKALMRDIMAKMSEAEIVAVAHYIASLK